MEDTTFTVRYTNKDIMDKLELIHTETATTNGTVKLHTKLIFGSYGFTLALLLVGFKLLL